MMNVTMKAAGFALAYLLASGGMSHAEETTPATPGGGAEEQAVIPKQAWYRFLLPYGSKQIDQEVAIRARLSKNNPQQGVELGNQKGKTEDASSQATIGQDAKQKLPSGNGEALVVAYPAVGQPATYKDDKTFVVERFVYSGETEFWQSLAGINAPKLDELEKSLLALGEPSNDEETRRKAALANQIAFWQRWTALQPRRAEGSLSDQFERLLVNQEIDFDGFSRICNEFTRWVLVENEKYVLAYLRPIWRPVADFRADGSVHVEISTGKFGRVFFSDKEDHSKSFRSRYFSEAQIRNRLSFKEGDPFNYETFYRDVFSLNSLPDLTLDGVLDVIEAEDLSRTVDTRFAVDEKLPLHATLQFDNTGTEATNEYRTAATLQYLNLTKHYDVLSLDLSTAIDTSTYSVAGSYYLPFAAFGRRAATTLFGGYSELDVDSIVEGIDIKGTGWFAGLQLQLALWEAARYQVDATVEYALRYTDSQLLSMDQAYPRELTIAPISLGLNYGETETDPIGGRNFAAYTFSINQGGVLGSDGDEQFEQVRVGAESDYLIHRLQAARLQRLGGREGKWLLYGKLDWQLSDAALAPSEQKTIGGMNTVRGYKERLALGDWGYNATIELRTPLFNRHVFGRRGRLQVDVPPDLVDELPDSKKGQPSRPKAALETLQFLVFSDFGYVQSNDSLPREITQTTMFSVGIGLRMSLSQHFLVRIDYAIPLENTDFDDYKMPLHFSLQAQF